MENQQYDVLSVRSAAQAKHGPQYDGSELSCPTPFELPPNSQPQAANSNAVSSNRRARELYKYFHPHDFETSLQHDKTADLLLTSQAQLVALKLGGKCLINFLDDSKQYVVAEANGQSSLGTRRGSAESLRLEEQLEEVQWINCRGSDSMENSVCHLTVETAYPDHAGPIPFFEVEDLRHDDRFSSIPLVTSPPHLRYYAGTPLFAQSGIAIGALVLVDNKPRSLMSEDDKSFLHDTAKNVMMLLELTLQSRDQSRLTHMNACMSRFMSSGDTSRPSPQRRPSSSLVARRHAFHKRASCDDDGISKVHVNTSGCHKEDCVDVPMSEESLRIDPNIINDVKDRGYATGEHDSEQMDHLRHGANVLREALGSESCGVVILDTESLSPVSPVQNMKDSSQPASANATTFRFKSGGPCPILASSISSGSETKWKASEPDSDKSFSTNGQFVPLPIEMISDILERYPSGHLWVYDSDGKICSDDESTSNANDYQIKQDGEMLLEHVTQASCLLMKPFWNARLDREVVAFVYSTSQYHVFTPEQDLPFINAFCNCVAVELVRLATIAADEQKSDFLGTISHELRSPLHGILASCEVLKDTHLSDAQEEAVKTIDGCGRTLHDTITMVLDWSKVNAFERDWRAVCASRRAAAASGRDVPNLSQAQLLPNLYGNMDLAAALREVVDGSVISHGLQDILEVDSTNLGASACGFPSDSGLYQKDANRARPRGLQPHLPVKVLLEVSQPTESWVYMTQPGAFRRVIMNLVGNGLKYTKKGHVKVSLRSESTSFGSTFEANDIRSAYENIILEVEDTGKGMSAEWLQTKAFTPFTQEDPLSAGTGLGLSLTKSIVDMLEGTIYISSVVGRGTTVQVSIPMLPRHAALSSSQDGTSLTAGTAPCTPQESVPVESLTRPTIATPKTSEYPFPGTLQASESQSITRSAEEVSSITPTEMSTTGPGSCITKPDEDTCEEGPSAIRIDKSKTEVAVPPGPVRAVTATPLTASQSIPRSARILLVDDNAVNLRLLSQYMSKMQYTNVTTACDGRIAADKFKEALDVSAAHEVIFMDLSMPVLDGFDATRVLREQERAHRERLPALSPPSPALIVALTGLASEKDRSRAFEAGIDLYMTKPASFKEISKMMAKWEVGLGTSATDE